MVWWGIIVAIVGYVMSMARHQDRVDATVVSGACRQLDRRFLCDVNIRYIVNGVTYLHVIRQLQQKQPLVRGDTIPIFYDRYNPHSVSYHFGPMIFGYLLVAVGLLLFFC